MERSAVVTGLLLAGLGFETVGRSTIIEKLNKLSPQGETALRDSVCTGLGLILKLNSALEELGSADV